MTPQAGYYRANRCHSPTHRESNLITCPIPFANLGRVNVRGIQARQVAQRAVVYARV
jgi:hypothetical protein